MTEAIARSAQWEHLGDARADAAIPLLSQQDADRVASATSSATSTKVVIRVNDEERRAVVGADIIIGGLLRGKSGIAGLAVVDVPERPASLLVRTLVHEEPSARRAATENPRQPSWSWRVYLTDTELRQPRRSPVWDGRTIDEAARSVVTTVSRANVLIGFNLLVSMEWAATRAEMAYTRDRFKELSQVLFNASNGQMLIERVHIASEGRHWNEAHVLIHASRHQPSNSSLGHFADGGQINMNPYDVWEPMVLLHEFGHLALGLQDEYKGPNDTAAECTAAKGNGSDPSFASGGDRETCVMSGGRNPWQKFCSGNPLNPHVDTTLQTVPCWTDVAEAFGPASGQPAATRWKLRTPDRVLFDLLPDSGIPLGVTTIGFPSARLRRSFIPVAALQPRWQLSRRLRPGECDGLVTVRVTESGAPVGGAKVSLVSGGARIEQGTTRAETKIYQDGSREQLGELLIRGAHIDDSVVVTLPGRRLGGTGTVNRCGQIVEIRLGSSRALPLIDLDTTEGIVVSSSGPGLEVVPDVAGWGPGEGPREVEGGAMVHVAGTGPRTVWLRSPAGLVNGALADLEEPLSVQMVQGGETAMLRLDGAPFTVRARVQRGEGSAELVVHGSSSLPVPSAADLAGAGMVLPPYAIALVGPSRRRIELRLEVNASVTRHSSASGGDYALMCSTDAETWRRVSLRTAPGAGALLGSLPEPCTFVLIALPA
ncbi:MAG: M64 family metallopeptidase [Humibacillus sp.]|nr:M64 family metallopeptidase [Humibacillus sp.]MDN5775595.1 M64 family metallopeptidase [Humibacillus sp.]